MRALDVSTVNGMGVEILQDSCTWRLNTAWGGRADVDVCSRRLRCAKAQQWKGWRECNCLRGDVSLSGRRRSAAVCGVELGG